MLVAYSLVDESFDGHMEKQEMETGNGNWKLKTEMDTQPLSCCSYSNVVGFRF